jgi:hypothetical protein
MKCLLLVRLSAPWRQGTRTKQKLRHKSAAAVAALGIEAAAIRLIYLAHSADLLQLAGAQ